MSILHLVYQTAALKQCLSRSTEDDIILLLGAGAPGCLEPEFLLSSEKTVCYVLKDALSAHNIGRQQLSARVRVIDYAEFVDLVVATSCSMAWF